LRTRPEHAGSAATGSAASPARPRRSTHAAGPCARVRSTPTHKNTTANSELQVRLWFEDTFGVLGIVSGRLEGRAKQRL
jgi:hypothetical protein